MAPLKPHFSEGWHAQALALADSMVTAGHFSAALWADALGAALAELGADQAPDTEDTYYHAVIDALEALTVAQTKIGSSDLTRRKEAWTRAYNETPHGKPVKLS